MDGIHHDHFLSQEFKGTFLCLKSVVMETWVKIPVSDAFTQKKKKSGNFWVMTDTQVIWIIWIKQLDSIYEEFPLQSKYSLNFWIEVAASEHDWS